MSSQPNKPTSRFAYRSKDPLWKQKQLEKDRFKELYENIKEQSFKAPEDQPKQQTLVLSSQESYLNYTANDNHLKLDCSHRQKIFDTTKNIQLITRSLPKPVNIQGIDVQTSFIQQENKNLQTSFREKSVANSQINFDKLNQSYMSISIFQDSDKEVELINKKQIFQPLVFPIKIVSQTRFKPQYHSIDIQTSLLSYNNKNIQTSFQPEFLNKNSVSYQQSLKQQNQQSELKLSAHMSRSQSIIQYNLLDQSQRQRTKTSNIDELALKYDYEKWHPQQQLNSNTLSVQGQYTYKFCRICLNHIKDVNLEIHSRFNCEEYKNTYEEMVYKFQYLLQYELNRQFDDQLSRDLCTIGLEILSQLQVCKTQKRREQLLRDLNNVQNSLFERKSSMTLPICDLFETIQAYL